jgi:hypothetical protein
LIQYDTSLRIGMTIGKRFNVMVMNQQQLIGFMLMHHIWLA